ncbi:hypothetical protein [Streptomyces triculaminicus]|uniref:hypothetical protein n=1 Tax=Streptomyces triculaminicus TaxID=2816232 RepID=UPI0037D9378B
MTVVPLRLVVREERTANQTPTPIVALWQAVADADLPVRCRERDEEAALQAALDADAVVTGMFPDTFGTAITPMHWTGYPPIDASYSSAACAVTYLGSADGVRGWWLHYTHRRDWTGQPQPVLTLIAPCACGTYLHAEIAHEEDLTVMLGELDTAPGAPVDCDYRLRVRSASYADPSHESVEQPF